MTKTQPKALTITMQPCKSSNISAHGYDAATKTLAVKFSGGAVYHYPDVPQEVVDKLCGAKSVGSFFASDIRNGFKGAKQDHYK